MYFSTKAGPWLRSAVQYSAGCVNSISSFIGVEQTYVILRVLNVLRLFHGGPCRLSYSGGENSATCLRVKWKTGTWQHCCGLTRLEMSLNRTQSLVCVYDIYQSIS